MYARVELKRGASFQATGRPSFKNGQVRYLTNESDINYFQLDPDFKVTLLDPPKTSAQKGAAPASAPPKPPPSPPASTGDSEGGEAGAELPEWKPSMNKGDLLAAAEARGIAVTPEDKKADIIELLRLHDEDAEGEDDDEDEDEDEGEDEETDEADGA